MGGRIPPDGHQEFKITFLSNEELNVNESVWILIRGGKPQKIDISAKAIVPRVRIVENDIDFGNVTLGNKGTFKITIANESAVHATLNIDLTNPLNLKEYFGVECLECLVDREHLNDDQSSFVMSVNKAESEDGDVSYNSDESIEENEEKEQRRVFNMVIKPKSSIYFCLKLTPDRVETYNFEFPVTILGYGKIEELQRMVHCRCIKPRCLIEPSLINFNKKVISHFEKPTPLQQEVTIANLDQIKSLPWRIEAKALNEERTFIAYDTEGIIGPS
jgi:hypothetical protein